MPRVWVREEVYRRLEREAAIQGLTVSEFVERLVLKHRRESASRSRRSS